MKTYSSSIAVVSPPRFAGLRKPSTANTMVTTAMPSSCVPVPTYVASHAACGGARNASPCTSFHPVSSCASSAVSSWLYLAMSRCSVRSMIMATMPVRKRTIMRELMMENQWMGSSCVSRYVSHRDAHFIGDFCTRTVHRSRAVGRSGAHARTSAGWRPGRH